MRLWSTLVSQSRHRYGHQPFTVMSASIAKMAMGDHATHRVDLAGELRDEIRIHHRCRVQPKFDGDHQLIDSGNTLIGVDKQPLPIERHYVYPQRVGFALDRRPRIELMGP